MVIDMNETRLNTVLQLRAFLDGTLEVQFQAIGNDAQRYDCIAAVLDRFVHRRLRRVDKGVVMRYLSDHGLLAPAAHAAGVSLPRWGDPGQALWRPRAGLARKFTVADVRLLAQTDAQHNTLSGPATQCLMQRAALWRFWPT